MPDQFGGTKGKKFKYEKFKELLLSGINRSSFDKREDIKNVFEKWRGEMG